MSGARHSLVDRLKERGFVDRWGFLSFAGVGALLILLAKHSGGNPVHIALVAAGAMLLYAGIVYRTGTGRLRGDQAGDNCYYLGLIYTLTSLAYAIFVFDPSSQAQTIIQGFGIALATTITGLILRVFFNQSRVDLVETEDTARIELAEAAGRLKAELSSMTVSFNDFGRRTRQSLEELRDAVVASLEETRDATQKSISEAAEHARASIGQDADGATNRAKRLASTTEKVIGGIERQAAAIEVIEGASARIASGLEAVQTAAEATKATVEQLSGAATEMAKVQANLGTTGADMMASAGQLLAHIQAFEGSIARLDGVIDARLKEITASPADLAAAARSQVDEAVLGIRKSLEKLALAQAKIAEELEASTSGSVALTARHNAELEAELGRSRSNVAKVHAALVEMTGELVAKLEPDAAL